MKFSEEVTQWTSIKIPANTKSVALRGNVICATTEPGSDYGLAGDELKGLSTSTAISLVVDSKVKYSQVAKFESTDGPGDWKVFSKSNVLETSRHKDLEISAMGYDERVEVPDNQTLFLSRDSIVALQGAHKLVKYNFTENAWLVWAWENTVDSWNLVILKITSFVGPRVAFHPKDIQWYHENYMPKYLKVKQFLHQLRLAWLRFSGKHARQLVQVTGPATILTRTILN